MHLSRHQKITVLAAAIAFGAALVWWATLLYAPRQEAVASATVPASPTHGVFAEALIPFGTPTPTPTPEQERVLQAAIAAYKAAGHPVRIEALQQYLTRHPASPWRAALLANIGLMYEQQAYLGRALDYLAQARQAMAKIHTPQQQALADAVLGRQLRLHAQLGHIQEVKALLATAGDRPLIGAAQEAKYQAGAALWEMQHSPTTALRCGLGALRSLLAQENASPALLQMIEKTPAQSYGTSLADLQALAATNGHAMQVVRWQAGQAIPVPAVVHLKVGHFAAIVGRDDERFHIQDAVLGHDTWVSREALESEASGYFLTPLATSAQASWHQVASADARRIIGAGNTANPMTPPLPDDDSPCENGGTAGMPACSINNAQTSLTLVDTPLSYSPPKGPEIAFRLKYFQRNVTQPANMTFANVGRLWTHNWMGYVQDDPARAGSNVRLFARNP